jgi:hypothetical protein
LSKNSSTEVTVSYLRYQPLLYGSALGAIADTETRSNAS